MKNLFAFTLLLVAALFVACSENDVEDTQYPQNTGQTVSGVKEIKIQTRSIVSNFAEGNKIGLYVVNYKNGSAQQLTSAANHISNKEFTYRNAEWVSDSPIYWADTQTHADFYCYSPYAANISDVNNYVVSVSSDQSQELNFRSSDFMWGKLSNQAPTDERVNLQMSHRMSRAVIKIRAGEGFSESDLQNGEMQVRINNVKNFGRVNLSNGNVTATGENSSVEAYRESENQYVAILIPQNVQQGNLITVVLNGLDYNLSKAINFESGKQYNFTITLSKLSGGINVGIDNWVDAGEDYGGTVM